MFKRGRQEKYGDFLRCVAGEKRNGRGKVGSITVFSFDVYFGGPFQGTGRPVRPPPYISRLGMSAVRRKRWPGCLFFSSDFSVAKGGEARGRVAV